jgi:hypothetical protein
VPLQEFLARLHCLQDVKIKVAAYFRHRALNGVVHQITRYDRVLSARRNSNAYMSRGMTRRWLQNDLITDSVACFDQRMKAGIDDRKDRVLIDYFCFEYCVRNLRNNIAI